HFGKKQKFKNPKYQKIYDIVLKAQEEAISKARSGMSGKQIDALARNIIEKSGYGAYFVHSTGHGVGLDIHELPRISRLSEECVEDGMVFSVEPGIYLPQEFGVRIEDLVVMKNGRAEVL
ncbi:M24 family metallopeptidase, partial [Helicobacter typhlonius]